MRTITITLLAALLGAPYCGHATPLMFQFEVFGLPGQGQMIGFGINNNNDIVGSVDDFSTGTRKPTGFIRDQNGTRIRLIDVPGSGPLNGTRASDINDDGVVVGTYVTESPGQADSHGFTWLDGAITTFDAPNARDTNANTINNLGVIGGRAFVPPNLQLGTAYTLEDGVYTYFLPSGVVGSFGIAINGINDHGNFVGRVLSGTAGFQSFAVFNGVYMPFEVPNATSTIAYGINNDNQIVGTFRDSGSNHGFLMDATGLYQIDVPDADDFGTFTYGINDAGFLAGGIDTPGFPSTQALFAAPCFEASPTCIEAPRIGGSLIDYSVVPIPPGLVLLASAFALLAGLRRVPSQRHSCVSGASTG